MLNQNHVLLLLGLAVSFIGAASTDLSCPDGVGQIGSEYTIVGDRSNYTGFVWVRPDDRYVVTCNPSCSPVAGYNATMNNTHSTLSIENVMIKDSGMWKIRDATVTDAVADDVCQLMVASPPQCNISSDTDTNALELGTNLTLTLELRGYYCSQQAGFDLTTGSVTDVMLQNQTTNNITDTVQHHSFNVTSDHFGDVSVIFRCDSSNKPLTCGGVSKLTGPPQCNISSDTDTNALELGTNLTLTLELKGYYCSQQAGFDLTTGSVTDVLLQNQTSNNITDTVQHHSFNVTSDHFGDVSVIFRCDNSNRTLSCGGVSKLTAATTTTTPGSTETSTNNSNSSMQTSSPSPSSIAISIAIAIAIAIAI
ncbi:uncharacterized protein LOC124266898 isoform X2 [Haliotis rubra]|uniref:uncharacterized protein LOC124266898 isoform X2 n=1 Tax=Haliotis rubra TaxID=36100 RepID=UPI001EE54E90|nr:uncharacterized protein LOC124266898 isoform X2 [Haliotis rubra]